MNLRLTRSRPICFPATSPVADCVNSMNVSGMAGVVLFIKGGTGDLSGRERCDSVDSPSGSGDADRTLSLPAMPPNAYALSWCSRPLSRAPCFGVSTLQMEQADSPPARFFQEATGPESSEDEFGILVDDRCTDTRVFQPSWCSPAASPRRRAPGSATLS